LDTFGILGFVFGIFAFTTTLSLKKKIEELEQRISQLENNK
jgi:hypothetical protein